MVRFRTGVDRENPPASGGVPPRFLHGSRRGTTQGPDVYLPGPVADVHDGAGCGSRQQQGGTRDPSSCGLPKDSGGNRAETGAESHSILMSIIRTCSKQGTSIIEYGMFLLAARNTGKEDPALLRS